MNNEYYFEQLFTTYYTKLYRYVCTLTHDENVAAEITSETFLRSVKKASLFMSYENPFAALKRTAMNLFYRQKTRVKQEKLEFEEFYRLYYTETFGDIEAIITAADETEKLQEAIKILNNGDRRLILLHCSYDLCFKAIADLIGIRYTTVLYRHQRALNLLREHLCGAGYTAPTYTSTGNRPKNLFYMYLSYILYLTRR